MDPNSLGPSSRPPDGDLVHEELGIRVDDAFTRNFGEIDDGDQVKRLLVDLIRSGRLTNRTLSASKLAKAFHLHRNTVSKVLGNLQELGYLRGRKGRAPVVVNVNPVLPERRGEFLSHQQIAQASGLEMRTVRVGTVHPCSAAEAEQAWQQPVMGPLELEPEDEVLALRRIRIVRGQPTRHQWVPAIAEDILFAKRRLPDYFPADLENEVVDGIRLYCDSHNIHVVTSEYRIGTSRFPRDYVAKWIELLPRLGPLRRRKEAARVSEQRFTRLEATTYTISGAMELSIAYLREGLFSIRASTLQVDFRPDRLAAEMPAQLERAQ